MYEMQNPRVPGLGLAPSTDVDRYVPRAQVALVREYGPGTVLHVASHQRHGPGFRAVLAKMLRTPARHPNEAKAPATMPGRHTRRPARQLVPQARA